MKYFDEMLDKYGFEDGGAIPPDAWKCREVYVAVVNKLAEKYGSAIQVLPFDRPGCHNGCMVIFITRGDEAHDEAVPDEQMQDAIADARDIDLDEFVITEVRIDDVEFNKFLAGL